MREPDAKGEFCPRCGSLGEPVESETLRARLTAELASRVAATANFCPSAQCPVVYFDMFERVVLAEELPAPVYPKDPAAPICACLGLTIDDIEQDVREGSVARTRAALEKAKAPDAACRLKAANGRSCAAYVQRCYMQLKQSLRP